MASMSSNVAAERLASRFHVKDAPYVTARMLRRTTLTFTELLSENNPTFETGKRVNEDAFVVGVQLRDFPRYQFREDGKQAPIANLRRGQLTINDMKRDATALMDKPFHSFYCHIPRTALDEITGAEGPRRIDTLRYAPGEGVDDEIANRLLMCVFPAIDGSQPTSNLFLDYIGLALVSHLVRRYGEAAPLPLIKGGLAPWQERLAKEIIQQQIQTPSGIAELAKECGLSVRHFTRAFQTSTGMTPHDWLQKCRVDHAKTLLKTTDLSLRDIGQACGFADQSHLSRVFTRTVGTPPGSWRRRLLHDRGL